MKHRQPLALLHATAYARDPSPNDPVFVERGTLRPYFGRRHGLLAFRHANWLFPDSRQDLAGSGDAEPKTASRSQRHLEESIEHFRSALEFSSKAELLSAGTAAVRHARVQSRLIRLGLAWCLAEQGHYDDAAKPLRILAKKAQGGSPGPDPYNFPIAKEALSLLLDLLERGHVVPSGEFEIQQLQDQSAALDKIYISH